MQWLLVRVLVLARRAGVRAWGLQGSAWGAGVVGLLVWEPIRVGLLGGVPQERGLLQRQLRVSLGVAEQEPERLAGLPFVAWVCPVGDQSAWALRRQL